MSPRENAGSIDSEMTTTMGDDELVTTHSDFHSMKVVEKIRENLRT
jgi:hypothetical protein